MSDISVDLAVLGSGPGGYAAAFRAADLGLSVAIIEKGDFGGVCLNVGCIPSKALLHAAKIIDESKEMEEFGITFGEPNIDVKKLRDWKDGIVTKLTGGLQMMAKMRKVQVVNGYGKFADANTIAVEGAGNVTFKNAIIAVGSEPVNLPFFPDDSRVFDSTGALKLEHTGGRMLVMGGGIIGLEMATVYEALGTKINIVEMLDGICAGADDDIVKPYMQRIQKRYENIWLKTKVTAMEAKKDGIHVTMETADGKTLNEVFDCVLTSVGRRPNGKLIDAEKAGVNVDERGFIAVDQQLRTNVPHIQAIGDVIGQPMLAHKATAEGRIAAEVVAGHKVVFDAKVIPSVAYTDPEIAWVGQTEKELKDAGVAYGKGVMPWQASGRALAMNRPEGMTKMLYDKESHRLLGVGIIGVGAGDLIGEAALAIEMGCEAEDIALTIHPHPTLCESLMIATEAFEGTATDLPPSKK